MNHAWQQEHNKIQPTIQYNHQTPIWIRSMRGWAYQRFAIFKLIFYLNEFAFSKMWKSVLQTYLEHMILKKCQCQDFVAFLKILKDFLTFDSHFEHIQLKIGIGQLHIGFDSIQLKIIELNLKLNLSWIESVHLRCLDEQLRLFG